MRKLLAVLGAMLLMSVSAIGAMAQGATPAAGAATAATSIDPAIGETVTYVDVSGNPIANVTVESAERNWQDYGEYDEPDPGVEYVAFTVTVESVITRGSVEVSDFDFTMQDASGFLWGTAYADAAEGAEVTTLDDDLALVSGDSATFLVVFEVLQDQPLAHLFWQPDSGRLITLAALDGV
jgi:polyisoprenoid-binding protein YceI